LRSIIYNSELSPPNFFLFTDISYRFFKLLNNKYESEIDLGDKRVWKGEQQTGKWKWNGWAFEKEGKLFDKVKDLREERAY